MLNHLFLTKNGIYSKVTKLLYSERYQECAPLAFNSFLSEHVDFFRRKNFSPWNLVFYSRLYLLTPPERFQKIITDTRAFIISHDLTFSLNDEHEIHGIKQPFLESFFHWGGSFQITPEFIKTVVSCGLKFDEGFYNKVLRLTQGLEVSESYQVTNNPRKWNFKVCHDVFRTYLQRDLVLEQENQKFIDYPDFN